jgi:hypothetical protein
MSSSKQNRVRKCKDCSQSYTGKHIRCEECLSKRRKQNIGYYNKIKGNHSLKTRCLWLISYAKKRAKKKNAEITIDVDWLINQIELQKNKCILTNKSFIIEHSSPWCPSIDRIDSSKGYTKENCRIVAWCVNNALNVWGDDVFYEMCKAALKNKKKV